jgi:hypothetical protein
MAKSRVLVLKYHDYDELRWDNTIRMESIQFR